MNSIRVSALLVSLLLAGCSMGAPEVPEKAVGIPAEWEAELETWKRERDASLRRPTGWLSLVGLFWLEEGANSFGSDPANDLVFPDPAPARMGTLVRTGNRVTVEAAKGVELTSAGEPVAWGATLVSDAEGTPTVLEHGTLSFHLLERGERVGIRLKDLASPLLASFEGMDYYPPDPAWRIEARWEPYGEPRAIEVPNILGDLSTSEAPGVAVFEIDGVEYRLTPTGDPTKPLFFVFGDETNAKTTYGGGRFVYAGPPVDGRIVLDFNRAYNPPCVFTPWATCPLPRPEDKLPIAIPAGEKKFGNLH